MVSVAEKCENKKPPLANQEGGKSCPLQRTPLFSDVITAGFIVTANIDLCVLWNGIRNGLGVALVLRSGSSWCLVGCDYEMYTVLFSLSTCRVVYVRSAKCQAALLLSLNLSALWHVFLASAKCTLHNTLDIIVFLNQIYLQRSSTYSGNRLPICLDEKVCTSWIIMHHNCNTCINI